MHYGITVLKRDEASFQIANGGKRPSFGRRSWRGLKTDRQVGIEPTQTNSEEQGMPAFPTRHRPYHDMGLMGHSHLRDVCPYFISTCQPLM
jgi:hypothetical protein